MPTQGFLLHARYHHPLKIKKCIPWKPTLHHKKLKKWHWGQKSRYDLETFAQGHMGKFPAQPSLESDELLQCQIS